MSNLGSRKTRLYPAEIIRVNELLQDPVVDRLVLTHGRNTMEETAYFLSLVAKSDQPIVMMCAMRPFTALSADGSMNLYDAIALAADPDARCRGALVVAESEIHFASEVEKSNTTRIDSFDSPNRGRAGLITNGQIVLVSLLALRYGLHNEFSVDDLTQPARVEIVYSYADFGRDIIDFLVSQGVKGLVLAGAGDGNTKDEPLAGLQDAAKKGIAVMRGSQTGSGLTCRNVYVDDDQAPG